MNYTMSKKNKIEENQEFEIIEINPESENMIKAIPDVVPKKTRNRKSKKQQNKKEPPTVIPITTIHEIPTRKHGQYVINVSPRPLFISGIGVEHALKGGAGNFKAIQLGVLGDDPSDLSLGISNIEHIPDEILDTSATYQTFLKKGSIIEVNENKKNAIMQKISEQQEKMAGRFARFQRIVEDDNTYKLRQRQSPSIEERQNNVIEQIELGRDNRIVSPIDTTIETNSYGRVNLSKEKMTDFFKNL